MSWPRSAVLICGLVFNGCTPDSSNPVETGFPPPGECTIPTGQIFDGGPGKDGIPALTDPPLVRPGQISYLQPGSRVIGLVVDGQAIAVPHNILWWHEIMNLNAGSKRLAITYCPLTGSSIVFDRDVIEGAEFGVSGLLFETNLIMYDRRDGESLWPQMSTEATCGPSTGVELEFYPSIEATWDGWQILHPNTLVVSANTGFARDYQLFPYGSYEEESNERLLFPVSDFDKRRPPKERVLGIPSQNGGLAIPFGAIDSRGPAAAEVVEVDERELVVLWDRGKGAAAAFEPFADGQRLTFRVDEDRIFDYETGSTWNVGGNAVTGPLSGSTLEPVEEAYVAFWFAWAVFQPDTRLWPKN